MKHITKILLPLFLISSFSNGAITSGRSFFRVRPQDVNTARRMVGLSGHIHHDDMDEPYGTVSIVESYNRSFNSSKLAKYLFFNDKDSMKFGTGPGVINTVSNVDVEATNFMLGVGFEGTVKAKPRIQSYVGDINTFLGLDSILEGLFFKLNTPIIYTQWRMNLVEDITTLGGDYDVNDLDLIAAAAPVNGIIDAWRGDKTYGHITEGMKYGKIDDTASNSKIRIGLEAVLGYNFIDKDWGYIGLNIRGNAPTGNKPTAEYLFEPIAGDYHWKLGGGLSAKFILWDDEQEDKSFNFILEGNAKHLFKRTMKRSFDFKRNGKGSRYNLLKKFNAAYAYNNILVSAINITTLDADVTIDVEGDLSAMLDYRNKNVTCGLGYNFYGRTKEKVSRKGNIKALYSFYEFSQTKVNNNNALVDVKIDGSFGTAAAQPNANTIIKSSYLDETSASSPSVMSHKVFGHMQYNWWDMNYSPFIGIGGEVEFSGRQNHALEQWGIWIKYGLDF